MKKTQYILATCLLLLIGTTLNAQKREQAELVRHVEEVLEYIAEESESNIDFGTYLEILTDLAENPINLNRTSLEELIALEGIITNSQMINLLKWREEIGKFFTIYELQAVPGFSVEDVKRVLPFVDVKGKIEDFRVPIGKLLFGGTHTIFTRYTRILESQDGYESRSETENDSTYTVPPKFLGSPDKIFSRYRYKYSSKISYGITGEKDAGEQFFNGINKQGFDFYSAHLYLKNVGIFKHIALGDYQIRLGQGLIAWTGLAFGKSSEVMGVMRQSQAIRPYTSVNEIDFNRGAAVTLGLLDNKLDVTLFGSYKRIDGGTTDTSSTSITSFDIDNPELGQLDAEFEINEEGDASASISGLHSTLSEANRKGGIRETKFGGSVKYNSRVLSVGLNAIHTKYSANEGAIFRIVPQDRPYNLFRFTGTESTNVSVDYRWLYKNFNFFGETGISDNGGFGTVNGVLMSLHPTVDASIVYRNYGPDFWTENGAAFRESGFFNEQGIFFGTVIKPLKGWRVNAYFDIYKFPWLRSTSDAPSYGMDRLIQLTYRPSRSLEMYVRYKSETKQQNLSGNVGNDFLSPHTTTALRFEAKYKISKAISMKTRIQIATFDNGADEMERGFLIFQDFNYKPFSFPVSFNTRFALFNTDSYDTRIYAYENDVLYSFSIPAYNGRGSRFYIMMRYKTRVGLDFWLRFAQTFYDDRNIIGSGNNEIQGRTKSEIKAQVRFKF